MSRYTVTLMLVVVAAAGCELPTVDLSGPFAPTSSPVSDELLLGDWNGQFTDGSESESIRLTIRSTRWTVVSPGVGWEGWWWSFTQNSGSGMLFGTFDVNSLSLEFDFGCYGKVTAKVAGNRMEGTYTGGDSCQHPVRSGRLELTRTCVGAFC